MKNDTSNAIRHPLKLWFCTGIGAVFLLACSPATEAPEPAETAPAAEEAPAKAELETPRATAPAPAPAPQMQQRVMTVPKGFPTREAGLVVAAQKDLGAGAKVKITSDNAQDGFHFICGDATSATSDTSPRTFCALVQKEGEAYQVREFELVGYDAPWIDWVEKYKLPEKILD